MILLSPQERHLSADGVRTVDEPNEQSAAGGLARTRRVGQVRHAGATGHRAEDGHPDDLSGVETDGGRGILMSAGVTLEISIVYAIIKFILYFFILVFFK